MFEINQQVFIMGRLDDRRKSVIMRQDMHSSTCSPILAGGFREMYKLPSEQKKLSLEP
jgi:hypothetical protein